MRVIETFLRGKRPDRTLCEDTYVLGEHFAAVIDGVTAKTLLRYPPAGPGGETRSPGRFAADVLGAYLGAEDFDGRLQAITFADLLRELDARLHDALVRAAYDGARGTLDHADAGSAEREPCVGVENPAALRPEDWLRACLVLYNDYRHEVWSYGDCQCIVDGAVITHEKEVDRINAARRCAAVEEFLAAGGKEDEVRAHDPGRDAIKPALIAQLHHENAADQLGYPVLNGRGVEPSLATVHPVIEGTEVVLASDGYPASCLRATLAESEERLRCVLARDPLCFRENKQTKGVQAGNESYDDRCYVRIAV